MADERPDPNDLRWQSAHYLVMPNLIARFDDRQKDGRIRVIVELNVDYPGGLDEARLGAIDVLAEAGVDAGRLAADEPARSRHNIFLDLSLAELKKLVALNRESLERQQEERAKAGPGKQEKAEKPFPIYKVWADEKLKPFNSRSIRTIKADACLTTFRSTGEGIVVAVADSGIDSTHEHFKHFKNLDLPKGIEHGDFTQPQPFQGSSALVDGFGHGTHVAGIIAGRHSAKKGGVIYLREEHVEETQHPGAPGGTIATTRENEEPVVLQGVAPQAKIVSLKVLDDDGSGYASNLISALEYLFQLNDSGRKLKVHCLNLSLGYPFEAEWYAAGQSPLCVAVSRLVSSGMVVVAAAGNDGSVNLQTDTGYKRFGLGQSINDPGNAEAAITVGSTHPESPHLYGVSYFSSRGPTADGRVKPDLLAPGERIISCAGNSAKTQDMLNRADAPKEKKVYYREESGTSMAAPHVAGAVAAFLSIQGEYIGRPEAVKKVFMSTCTDLGRKQDFQGAGLIDLMRAVQSV